MKLISLKIKGFKNLDFWDNKIDFTKSQGISIFVGNNGSGKSNVLEAISAIFYGLYNKQNFDPIFEFELVYKIKLNSYLSTEKGETIIFGEGQKLVVSSNEIIFEVKHENSFLSFYINGKNISLNHEQINTYLPSQIIALHSGEETRLYEDYYKKSSEKMIFIDKNYWNIALLTMFFSITDFDDKDLIYKGLQNIIGNGLKIQEISFIDGKTETKTILDDFRKMELNREEIYKYLKDVKNIDLILSNGINTKDLSEGQKKQIIIFFATNFLADKDSIILLDEPDSYIHVGNKQRLKEFFDDFLNITKEGEFILTTHSPTLMNLFGENHISDLDNGKIIGKSKKDILKEISGDTMSYTEQQIVLNTSKDIIIVEGKTDEIYIQTALEKLKEDNPQYKNLDFEFLLMGGSDHEILKRFSEQFPAKKGQKIMAFFDRDDAGLKCIKNSLGE